MATSKPNLLDVRFNSWLWLIRDFLGRATPVILLKLDTVFVERNGMPKGAHDVISSSEAKLDSTDVADRVHGIPVRDGSANSKTCST